MFRSQLLRQARACRGLRASPSSLLASGSGLAPRTATTYGPAVLTASVSRQIISRAYSSSAAEARSDNAGNSTGLITRFADLSTLGVHDSLISAITKTMNFETMTDVQAMSINPALQGKDLVAQARTGTGKTLGFLLPVLQKIIQGDPGLAENRRSSSPPRADDIRGIIISPTRELAEQIAVEAERVCRFTGIKVQCAVGGHNKREMLYKTRREGCHLLVGTPGRLKDLLSDGRSGIAAPNLDAFVLDEADRLIEVGFERELREILKLLPDRREKPRQTLLFSATIPRNVVSLARSYIDPSSFQFVQTINSEEAPTHEKVPQHIVTVPGVEHWAPILLEMAEKYRGTGSRPFKAIAFFNNTSTVRMMSDLFRQLRDSREVVLPRTYGIHSGLTQMSRTNVAERFRQADSAILISTDVTARGMDFPNVTHVIQFGVPSSRDAYIHRLGRTGRAGKEGQGYLVILQHEVDHARDTLPGLPIKRNDEFEAAKIDTSTFAPNELPKYFTAVNAAMRRVNPADIEEAYTTMLTASLPHIRRTADKQEHVNALNRWVTTQAHQERPPPVEERFLGRNASFLSGLNIGPRRVMSGRQDNGRRGNFRGGPSYDRFSNDRRSNDRFSNDRFSNDRFSNDRRPNDWFSNDRRPDDRFSRTQDRGGFQSRGPPRPPRISPSPF